MIRESLSRVNVTMGAFGSRLSTSHERLFSDIPIPTPILDESNVKRYISGVLWGMDIRDRLKDHCRTVNSTLYTQPPAHLRDQFLSSLVTASLPDLYGGDGQEPFVRLRDRYPGLVLVQSPWSRRTFPEDLDGLISVSGHLGSGVHVVGEQDLWKVGATIEFLLSNYAKDLHKQMMDLFDREAVTELRHRTIVDRILRVRDRMAKSFIDPFPCNRYVLLVGVEVNGGHRDPECAGLPGYQATVEDVDIFTVKTSGNQYQFGVLLVPNCIGVKVEGPLECRYGDDTNFGTTGSFKWYRKYGLKLIDPTAITRVRLNWPVGIDL